jgi:hypothetical protein
MEAAAERRNRSNFLRLDVEIKCDALRAPMVAVRKDPLQNPS